MESNSQSCVYDVFLYFSEADVIVSNGGTSIGENDYIKPILRHIGANIHFGQVNIQPG